MANNAVHDGGAGNPNELGIPRTSIHRWLPKAQRGLLQKQAELFVKPPVAAKPASGGRRAGGGGGEDGEGGDDGGGGVGDGVLLADDGTMATNGRAGGEDVGHDDVGGINGVGTATTATSTMTMPTTTTLKRIKQETDIF